MAYETTGQSVPGAFAYGLDETATPATPATELAVAPNPVEALDLWARHVWHHRRTSAWVALAVPTWAVIRLGYRIAQLTGWAFHYLGLPFTWLYWRVYELCGPPMRLGKAVFWRLSRRFSPLGGMCKRAYWRFVFPPLERAWVLTRWMYWRGLFPILKHPARWLGFSLSPHAPKAASETPQPFLNDFRGAALVWIARTLSDFDALFDCLPRYGLSQPANGDLHVWLAPELAALEPLQIRLLGLRLRSGAPLKRVHLYAPDTQTAKVLEQSLGACVHIATSDTVEFAELVRAGELAESASLTVDRFGPVVLLISALWGRVGSTLIFDAQTQFLIENGAVVVRIFVDHYPGHGQADKDHRLTLLQENLTVTYPHLQLVAERDEDPRVRRALHQREDYSKASGVRRLELELEGAKPSDAGLLQWAGAAARMCVVNHAMHMAFAERITAAPIVLETHDVLIHQLDSHGWPSFVSFKREPEHLREHDQRAMWRRAKACVNLSPEDQATIAPHAGASTFVRPAAAKGLPRLRPWDVVVHVNGLPPEFAASEEIDILLWGDWHEGNARAVQWVLEKVCGADPSLSDARIAVIGRVTRVLPAYLLKLPNVVSCGFVDRLEDFFGRAKVLAIADQDGSGTSIKAIDALRFGLPFASTRAGLRGLDLRGVAYAPADCPADFAADLAGLLNSEVARVERAALAATLYERNISHDAYEAEWRRIIGTVDPDFATANNTARLIEAPKAHTPGPALRIIPIAPRQRQAAPPATYPDVAPAPAALARSSHALAAVICTYDRYDILPGAIDSLLAQNIAADDLDILVIDNSPDQDAAAAFGARYQGTRVRYIVEPIPGLSNARNVGANVSGAQYVAYIDDDAVAAPDWARCLLAALQSFSPRAGVAGGRIIPRWVSPRPDWLPDELIGNLSIVDWGGVARPLGRTEWIAGCNIAFERRMLLELGGFSRALGRVGSGAALLSNEESEVIEKFAEAGRIAIYAPDATVEHLIEPARLSQAWFRRRAAWQAVSDYIKDPKKAAAYSGAAAERLLRELMSDDDNLPPGFVRPHAKREAFRRDVGLMYDIVIAMLAGGVELNADGASNASLHEKLIASVRREVQRSPQLRAAIRKLANL